MNNRKSGEINEFHKKLAVKTTIQFLVVAIVYEVAWLLLNLLFLVIMGATNLDTTKAFEAYKPYMIPIMIIVSIIGIMYISYRFMRKPLEYLEEVASAAKKLAHPTDAPIELSPSLDVMENDLNIVREEVLKSRKEASISEQRKNDLLVYLAHDLKTPLTSVIGYVKLIEDEPELSPELIHKYSTIAREKAERLEELINEFFEITRFNTQNLIIEKSDVNLSRMIMQIANEFNPLLADKNLTFNLQVDEGIVLKCDPDKIERAVDNLLRNAINYSYENEEIFLSLTRIDDQIRICVQNKGDTIPAEKLDRIFEQFYRLDSSRASSTGGAGLGLAITKEIVQLHDGTITAYSDDHTIRFIIMLPLMS